MKKNTFLIKSSLMLLFLSFITLSIYAGFNISAQQMPLVGAGSAYKTTITPHWFTDKMRFWYCNDLQGGKREFILVDASKGVRKPAFDHKQLAKGKCGTSIRN